MAGLLLVDLPLPSIHPRTILRVEVRVRTISIADICEPCRARWQAEEAFTAAQHGDAVAFARELKRRWYYTA